MEIKNYMELVVDSLLPDLLERNSSICRCKQCRADIKAIALNNLPPKYIVAQRKDIFLKINELSIQFESEVVAAILEAIQKVKKSPRH